MMDWAKKIFIGKVLLELDNENKIGPRTNLLVSVHLTIHKFYKV